MNIFALLFGLLFIGLGIGAIAGADFWDGWEWVLSGSAITAGAAGLVSLATRRDDATG